MATPAQYLGTGKRKTSVARVILRPGDGATWINGKTIEEYFPRLVHRKLAIAPLETAGLEGQYDLRVRVHGGGPSGQAGAVRHGIARALVEVNPELRVPLKRAGFLTRDARVGRAQEGRPAQGAQGAAVQQAVTSAARGAEVLRHRRCARRRRRVPDARARRAPRPRGGALDAARRKVFVGRDTRALGRRARGGVRARRRLGRRRLRSSAACCRRRRSRCSRSTSASSSPPRTTRPSTTASSSSTREGRKLSDAVGGGDRGAARRGARHDQGRDRARRGRGRRVPRARRRALRLRPHAACASSSTARTARTRGSRRSAFERLGAEVHAIGDAPDGDEHQRRLRRHRHWRCSQQTVVDGGSTSASPSTATATGCSRSTSAARLVDGDQIVAILALDLGVDLVAVTRMTNLGFHALMRERGIRVVTTDVGDRYVLEALQARGRRARRRAVGSRDLPARPRHRRRPRRRRSCSARRSKGRPLSRGRRR